MHKLNSQKNITANRQQKIKLESKKELYLHMVLMSKSKSQQMDEVQINSTVKNTSLQQM
jgi:hypothetical protein